MTHDVAGCALLACELCDALVQGDRWSWPRRAPDLAGPRPASWRPCSSAALTTSTWARAAAIPSY